eukprot:7377482-Prymnesium_polylepis.1
MCNALEGAAFDSCVRGGVAYWCYEGLCGLVNGGRRTFSNRCPHNAGMTSPKPAPAAPRPPKEGKGGDLWWVKKLAGRASYVYFRGGSSSPSAAFAQLSG